MSNRKSEENSYSQFILGLSPKTVRTVNFIVGIFGILGILIGVAFALHEIRVIFPQEREEYKSQIKAIKDIQKLQLNAAVANLAVQEKPNITSPYIQNNLEMLRREGVPTTGIAAPGTRFTMAEFEDVDWQGVIMGGAEFVCSVQEYYKITNWEDGDPRIPLCTRLKKADFTGASLREAGFNYADLRGVNFTAADLSKAKIDHSVASSGAKFLEDVRLLGIEIKNSDFSGAQFGTDAEFKCTVNNKKCVKLRRSDFSSAVMNDVRFRGAKIDGVDFIGAELKGAQFGCGSAPDGDERCTKIEHTCFSRAALAEVRFRGVAISNVDLSRADLTRARFENTAISNTVFSGATLVGARFEDVRFKNVVFPRELSASAQFDSASAASLEGERVQALDGPNSRPDERPCTTAWRDKLGAWKRAVVFSP